MKYFECVDVNTKSKAIEYSEKLKLQGRNSWYLEFEYKNIRWYVVYYTTLEKKNS